MINDASVEAAAKAIRESVQPTQAAIIGPYAASEMQARAALEAASAILMAQAWEDGKLAQFETELTGQPIRDNPYGGNGA